MAQRCAHLSSNLSVEKLVLNSAMPSKSDPCKLICCWQHYRCSFVDATRNIPQMGDSQAKSLQIRALEERERAYGSSSEPGAKNNAHHGQFRFFATTPSPLNAIGPRDSPGRIRRQGEVLIICGVASSTPGSGSWVGQEDFCTQMGVDFSTCYNWRRSSLARLA